MMKKAFTLVELLIVVVVIVTLMGITFRINSVAKESTKLNTTVNHMQRLENCLSGYYAAFGSYPPVKIHGTRDYRCKVNKQGIQQLKEERWTELNEDSVRAACRSQPVAFEFPTTQATSKGMVELLQHKYSSADNYFVMLYDPSILSSKSDETSWSKVQLFKFGLLSYLLPRCLIAIMSDRNDTSVQTTAKNFYENQKQWTANNELPCQFENGMPYANWSAVADDLAKKRWAVELLPSQAICARWLPNLDGILVGGMSIEHKSFYGVVLASKGNWPWDRQSKVQEPPRYSAGDTQSGSNGGGSNLYGLDVLDCWDGWNNSLYYYSLPPYQSYRLWSSGPDMKTFPPWITNEELLKLNESDRKLAQEWVKDDIVHLSH